jgi:insertion element IS1 protein InsB
MAFSNKKQRKIWIWRAVDCRTNKTIGWVVGGRNAKTFKRLFEKLKYKVNHFYTDDWKTYKKIIPAERHTIGKKHTVGIEQSNSNIRHYLARFTRRTKVVSKSVAMIEISLLITCNHC